jgi:hypothetical protein
LWWQKIPTGPNAQSGQDDQGSLCLLPTKLQSRSEKLGRERDEKEAIEAAEREQAMRTATMLSAQEGAQETFGRVRLGEARRTKRAVQMATALAREPAASFPAQLHEQAALKAASRFLQTPAITSEQLMAPHLADSSASHQRTRRGLVASSSHGSGFPAACQEHRPRSHRQCHPSGLFAANRAGDPPRDEGGRGQCEA